jgi:hypothetical protein
MTDRERRFQLWGWGLFVLCALFYMAASARAGDVLTLVGSVVFLVACFIFIIPLLKSAEDEG